VDIKRLVSHFTYRIEPNPEGGFVARATDPAIPALQANTREELQQKIQSNINMALAAEFPGLKLPLENRTTRFDFHIEPKPGGGFAIHSADPNVKPIEGATHEEIENPFLEKLVGFVGKHVPPEMLQALAAQGNSGQIKISVTRKTGFLPDLASKSNTGIVQDSSSGAVQSEDKKLEDASAASTNFGATGQVIDNSPIAPERNSGWNILRFFITLLVLAGLLYLFLHRS